MVTSGEPTLVNTFGKEAPIIQPLLLGECEYDCDFDTDCSPGLLCADEHKKELAAVGLKPRKAYCGNVGGKFLEVCYNPTMVIADDVCVDYNFDEYVIKDTSLQYDLIQFYRGLLWSNLYIQDIDESTNTGYFYGTTSLRNHMFNGFGNSGTITALSKKRSFSVKSFMVTPVFQSGLEFIISGNNSTMDLVAYESYRLGNITDPVLIELDDTFNNLYQFKVEIATLSWVAIDDLVICH